MAGFVALLFSQPRECEVPGRPETVQAHGGGLKDARGPVHVGVPAQVVVLGQLNTGKPATDLSALGHSHFPQPVCL